MPPLSKNCGPQLFKFRCKCMYFILHTQIINILFLYLPNKIYQIMKEKSWIMQKLNDWANGFNNSAIGWSGKKLTIFAVTTTSFCFPIIMWTVWAYKHSDWSLLTGLIVIVSSLITSLFAANIVDKYKNPTETELKSPPAEPEMKSDKPTE